MGFWNGSVSPVGLIAGTGEYPLVFAEAFSSQKKKLIVIGVEGLADKRLGEWAAEAHYLALGDLDGLIALLKKKQIKEVVFAGGIPKKEIYNPSFQQDTQAKGFMQGVRNKGDDHLIRAFGLFLKARCGVSVMDPRGLLKSILATKGNMTRRTLSPVEMADIKFGFRIAKEIGRMDIGQTVIVRSGVVLAVEALEGTNQALRRGAELGHGEVTAVKVAKPKQDLRFDLPCVGFETLSIMAENGIRVLAVEAGKTIMLNKETLIKTANEKNLTLVGL